MDLASDAPIKTLYTVHSYEFVPLWSLTLLIDEIFSFPQAEEEVVNEEEKPEEEPKPVMGKILFVMG